MSGQHERVTEIELERIDRGRGLWPRLTYDETRIATFTDLYAADGPEALPPVQLVPTDVRSFLPADGRHRIEAVLTLGWTTIPAITISPPEGYTPERFAYEEALRTASTSALPLTRVERRRAIERLLAETPDLSDRHIARLVGVAHTTVSRIRNGRGATHQREPGETRLVEHSAAETAVRLLRSLDKLRESRGLGIRDRLFGDRMGERLADAIRDAHEDSALDRAEEYRTWFQAAVDALGSD